MSAVSLDPVGKRVEVLFDDDGEWYEGVVASYKADLKGDVITRRIKISYDDGTTSAWLDAAAEQEAGQLKYKEEGTSTRASASSLEARPNKKQKTSAASSTAGASSSNAVVVAALPGAVPKQPRDLGGQKNSESELLAGPAAGQKGITRDALGKNSAALGLASSAIQGAICTKGGAVSHLVLNEEFNDLAPAASEIQEFWVSDGAQRNKNAQMLNPATSSPQSSMPIFWVADKQNRKGGDLAVYVGHFTAMRVSTFSPLVPFKKAERKSLVELRFDAFDTDFVKKLDAVSDGDGVSVKSEVKLEVKSEVKSEAAGPSGSGKGEIKASAKQPVVVAFNFRCYETHMFNEGELEGTMNVPMLQDPHTGLCELDEGRVECNGLFSEGESVSEGEAVCMLFHKQNASVSSFHFGYALEPDEFGLRKSVLSKADDFGAFKCTSTAELAAWEKHQGGTLSTYCYIDMGECKDYYRQERRGYDDSNSDDDDSDDEPWDANYKLKLYTVLSAFKPGQTATDLPKWSAKMGYEPDWSALEAVVFARFRRKGTEWARRAVGQYVRFLELKKAKQDWASEVYAPSGAIDEVWHAHLSFVERYQRDIRAFTSGHLILHSPVLGDKPKALYAAAHEAHVQRMKQLKASVDKEFWPDPKAAEIAAKYRVEHAGDSDDHVTDEVWGQPSCA